MSYKRNGTIPASQGGTGQSTLTANQIIAGNGASGLQSISNGTSTWVMTSAGGSSFPSFQAGPSLQSSVVTSYISNGSGNHTFNASTVFVNVTCFGAGGGGGSGRSGANLGSSGGAGGNGGGVNSATVPVSFFGGAGATVAYTVGLGGPLTNGVSNSNGTGGGTGGNTSFGNIIAIGGTPGGGGSTSAPGGASGVNSFWSGTASFTSAISGAAGLGGNAPAGPGAIVNTTWPTGGGGGGGGNSGANTSGSAGGDINYQKTGGDVQALAGGTAGNGAGTRNGGPGSSATSSPYGLGLLGGTGAGGGGYTSTGTAGNGGTGGFPGGGGGGGSGSVSTVTSGAGGAGADGAIYIIEYT